MKPDKAESLIGNYIYIHKAQKEPCFIGGKILEVHLVDSERGDRHCIQFEVDNSVEGKLYGRWGSGSAVAFEPVKVTA